MLFPLGIEKLCQSMVEWVAPAPFWVVTNKLFPLLVMVACPTNATPPVGLAKAKPGVAPQATATPSAMAVKPHAGVGMMCVPPEAPVPGDRPRPAEISATATIAPKD